MEIQNQEILNKLDKLQIDINFIKKNMQDPAISLTPGEEERLDNAMEEYEIGETVSLEEIKRERENANLEV